MSYKENHNVLSIHICMCVYVQIHPVCICVSICIWMGVSIHTLTHTHIHTKLRTVRNFCSNFTLLCHPLPLMKAHHSFPPPLTELLGEEVGDWHSQPPLSQAHLTRSLAHIIVEQKWSVQEWKTESSLSMGSLVLYVLESTRSCGRSVGSQVSRATSNRFCWFHLLNVIVAQAYETQK